MGGLAGSLSDLEDAIGRQLVCLEVGRALIQSSARSCLSTVASPGSCKPIRLCHSGSGRNMTASDSTLERLSSPVVLVPGRSRTRVTEVAPETTDEGIALDVSSSMPVS